MPKFRGEVFTHFQAVAVKYHSSKRNWLLGLLGQILCELMWKKMLSMLLALLYICLAFFSVLVSLDFPCMAHAFACLTIARVSFSLFPRFAQNSMLFLCQIHCEIASAPNKTT
jgi:hypothetical protein